MRISWTALDVFEATKAYVSPLRRVNTSSANGSSSASYARPAASRALWNAAPAASRVAFSWTRMSCTASSDCADTMAYVSPLRRVNASTSKGFLSAVKTAPSTALWPSPSSRVMLPLFAT